MLFDALRSLSLKCVRDEEYCLYRCLAVVKLCRSLETFIPDNLDAVTRSKILEEAFEFFSNIKDTPRDGNVENLPLFKELRATGAGVKYKQRLEQFAKEWTNACKDDDNRRKLSNSITMKLQVQQNMAQQNTAQVSVRVLLREDLWSRPNQIIEREFICLSHENLDCLLWRLNKRWLRSRKYAIFAQNPYFYDEKHLKTQSWFYKNRYSGVQPEPFARSVLPDEELVVYIDRYRGVWLQCGKTRFSNICELDIPRESSLVVGGQQSIHIHGGYGGHGGGGVRTGGQGGIGGGPLLTNVTIIQSSESGTKNGKGLQAENQEAYVLKDALGVLHNSVKFDGLFRTQQYTLFTWKAGQRQEHPDTYTWPKLLHAWNTRKFDTPIEFETPIAFIESSIPLHPSPLDTLKFPPPLHETGVSINQTADAIILPVLQPIPTESRLLASPKAEAIVNAAADSDSDSDSEGTFHDAFDGIVPESLPNDSAVDLPAGLPAESVRESSPLPVKSTHAAKSTHGPEVLGKTSYILSPSENATRHASVAPIATSTIIPPPPPSTLPHPRLPHMLSPPDIATKHPSAAPIVTSAVNHPPTPTPSHPRPPHKEIRYDPVTAPQKGVGWFAKVKKWFIK